MQCLFWIDDLYCYVNLLFSMGRPYICLKRSALPLSINCLICSHLPFINYQELFLKFLSFEFAFESVAAMKPICSLIVY